MVTTIFEEVVEEVWHCSAPLAKPYFPSLEGAVPLGADVLRQAGTPAPTVDLVPEPWKSMIRCMSEGQWTVTMLDDLHVNIPGAEWVPFGVGVCLDRDCSTIIKNGLLTLGLTGFGAALTGAVAVSPAIAAGLAAALGVAVAAVPGIVTGAVAVLGWHSIMLGSQMAIWDHFGMAPRGYCLTYPTFPLMAAQVLLGPLLIPFAASIPVIAVPQ
jgi:hypothetical protein